MSATKEILRKNRNVFKKNNVSYLKSLTSKRDPNKEEIQKVIELYEQRRYQEEIQLCY